MELTCPIVRQLNPIDFTEPGLIKRIRGNAYCTKVSPQIANRVAESSRGESDSSAVPYSISLVKQLAPLAAVPKTFKKDDGPGRTPFTSIF